MVNKKYMKKLILIAVIIFSSICVNAQTWHVGNTYTTEWKTTNTIDYDIKGDTAWVYSKWDYGFDSTITFTNIKAGKGNPNTYFQNRINGQGVVQQRWYVVEYENTPNIQDVYKTTVSARISNAKSIEIKPK